MKLLKSVSCVSTIHSGSRGACFGAINAQCRVELGLADGAQLDRQRDESRRPLLVVRVPGVTIGSAILAF